jgi:WD40 repeat protein
MRKIWLLFPLILLILSLVHAKKQEGTQKQEGMQRIFVESSLNVFAKSGEPLAFAYCDELKQFYVAAREGAHIYPDQVFIYDQQNKLIQKLFVGKMNDMAVDSKGQLYIASDRGVKVFDRSGEFLKSFGASLVDSVAVLSDGRIVVASPNSQGLIHIYNPDSQWFVSAGTMKNLDPKPEQNRWLNSGKIVVGSSDEIYYVFKNAAKPLLLKFSSTGELLMSRKITGEAISIQAERQRQFLASKRMSNRIGGFLIVNSATVDPESGHLWIALNGSPTSGVIYEYSSEGIKLRELNLVVNANRPVYSAGAICMLRGMLYAIVNRGQAYAFDLSNPVNGVDFVRLLDSQVQPLSAPCVAV